MRNTTLALIEALVQQGLLSRERAQALLRQAQRVPAAIPSTAQAQATPPTAAPAAARPGVVRVPYIPETLRAQMREEIKNEVLATAREERWADPRQIPPWLSGLTLSGDIRVRVQSDRFADAVLAAGGGPCALLSGNLPASCYRSQTTSPAWAPDLINTTNDRDRFTLRARLGVMANIGSEVAMGLRLSTGNANSGPTSTSVTLGNYFNRPALLVDRAWIRWEPRKDIRVFAGRMTNPFFSTDLLWPDDLAFDGVAVQAERKLAKGAQAFAAAGVFPLEEFNVSGSDKWLFGAQVGFDWAIGDTTQWRTGLAWYDFQRIEGVRESNLPPTGALAGTVPYFTSQYPTSIRAKGNTLINLTAPGGSSATWGLASKFQPINLTTSLTLNQFDPLRIVASLDWVRNSAFDLADIRKRAGASEVDDLVARTSGLQARISIGSPTLGNRGDWQLTAAMRRFERDAWVDGFTDTTWHLGGTSYKGFSLGGTYAFDRRSTLGLRLTSTRNLDDGVRFLAVPGDPSSLSANLSSAPLKIDVIQVDLNTRF